MTDGYIFDGKPRNGDFVVRTPRVSDAIGQTLKNVYSTRGLPDDMRALLSEIDRAAIH